MVAARPPRRTWLPAPFLLPGRIKVIVIVVVVVVVVVVMVLLHGRINVMVIIIATTTASSSWGCYLQWWEIELVIVFMIW